MKVFELRTLKRPGSIVLHCVSPVRSVIRSLDEYWGLKILRYVSPGGNRTALSHLVFTNRKIGRRNTEQQHNESKQFAVCFSCERMELCCSHHVFYLGRLNPFLSKIAIGCCFLVVLQIEGQT